VAADLVAGARAVGAARRVRAADLGGHRLPRQRAALHPDAVVAVRVHRAAVAAAGDRHRVRVGGVGAAAHAAGDLYGLAGFDVVDDVVRRHRVDRDRGGGAVAADLVAGARAVGAARRVRAADLGGHRLPRQRAALHPDAVVAVRVHRAAVAAAAHRQRDRVAGVGAAAHAAGDLYGLAGFDVVDDVVRRH